MRSALLLLLALPAHAEPLDDWLGALQPQHDQVLIIPSIERVAGPAQDAWARLTRHPLFGARADEAKDALTQILVQYPPNLDEHVRHGLDASGSALLVWGPNARVDILPFATRASAEGWMRGMLGVTPEPNAGGWNVGEGAAAYARGHLFLGPNAAALSPFVDAKSATPELDCPRPAGQADLYFLRRGAGPGGCVTVRIDPDRVLVEARLRRVEALRQSLRPAADLYPHLGAGATSSLVVGLGPAALATLKARAPHPFVAAWDGRLALASGPKITDLTVIVGQSKPALPDLPFPPDVQVKRTKEMVSIYRPTPKDWPARVPKVEDAWIDLVPGGVRLRTHAAKGDPRSASGRGRADLSVLKDAALGVHLRMAGKPHDGSIYADALSPTLRLLDLDPQAVREWAGGLAYVAAHLAELVLSARYKGDALAVSLEVVLL